MKRNEYPNNKKGSEDSKSLCSEIEKIIKEAVDGYMPKITTEKYAQIMMHALTCPKCEQKLEALNQHKKG